MLDISPSHQSPDPFPRDVPARDTKLLSVIFKILTSKKTFDTFRGKGTAHGFIGGSMLNEGNFL